MFGVVWKWQIFIVVYPTVHLHIDNNNTCQVQLAYLKPSATCCGFSYKQSLGCTEI